VSGDKPLDEKQLAALFNDVIIPAYVNRPAPPEPEASYTEAEIVKVLVEKKYLEPGQKLADLPVKATSIGEVE
jgi:hypothetical protein